MSEKKTGRIWRIIVGMLLLSMVCSIWLWCCWREQKVLNYEEAIEIAVQDTGLNQNSAHISCIYREACQEYEIQISNSDYTQKYQYTISEKDGEIKKKE